MVRYSPSLVSARHAGFTLVELVLVIILLAVVATFSSRFIASNVQLYQTTANQNERLNDGRFIINRLNKDLNSAIAFSLKIDNDNGQAVQCLRFVPFIAASQYLGNITDNYRVRVMMDARSREGLLDLSTLVENTTLGLSVATTNAHDFYPLNNVASADATTAKIKTYTPAVGAKPTQADIELVSPLNLSSAAARYFIYDQQVSYCLTRTGDGSLNLYRDVQPLTARLGHGSLMMQRLSPDSRFVLTGASQFSHAIVAVELGLLLRDGSNIRFDQQMVMNNVP